MEKLLLLHPSVQLCHALQIAFHEKYTVTTTPSLQEGLDHLHRNQFAAILVSGEYPDISTTEVLDLLRAHEPLHAPVIVVADDSVERATAAMRHGAYDVLPLQTPAVLAARVLGILERHAVEQREHCIARAHTAINERFVYSGETMRRIDLEITRLANLDFDVLLRGETGAGKDLIAAQLHMRSTRHGQPFVHIPLKSLSETLIESELFGHERGAFSNAERSKTGRFEAAQHGTIYIPEISTLSESLQLKLQYFLQYKRISRVGQDPHRPEIALDVRLIMATNDNLEELVAAGRIRKDFYHRITGVRLDIPPLRERIEDIEPLAFCFLERHAGTGIASRYSIPPETLALLREYHWPGNVRELENTIKNALTYSEGYLLTPHHFPHLNGQQRTEGCITVNHPHPASFREAEQEFRAGYFRTLLDLTRHNIPQTAQLASMTPQGVRKILNALNLK